MTPSTNIYSSDQQWVNYRIRARFGCSQSNWLCCFMPKTLIERLTDLLNVICLNWHTACCDNRIYITIHLKVSTRKSVNRVAGCPVTLFKGHAVYWYMFSSAKEVCIYLYILVWLCIRPRSFCLNFRTVRLGLHLHLLDVYVFEHSQISLAWNLWWTFTVAETGSGTEL
jgi:hypothetical protein